MTKKITLALVLVIFIAFAFNVLAQGRELEIKYPEVQGEKPEETTAQIPAYVKYIFNFLIGISGVIALGALIYAGFQWFTSAGSPEKIQNAKDQISAALLGLLILFGSYLILTTINPDLVVFKLKRLRPIISELPLGVLVCKEEMEVGRAWQLQNNFKWAEEYWQQIEIKKELDAILEEIALKCYSVAGAGDIMAAFDNKVKVVYFIPHIWTAKCSPPQEEDDWEEGDLCEYETEYGAIFYEGTNYDGKSKPYYEHLVSKDGGWEPYRRMIPDGLEPSSIKPFSLIYEPNENWEVILYEKTNFNKGIKETGKETLPENAPPGYRLPENYWYLEIDGRGAMWGEETGGWPWSPQSIKIEGDLLAILFTEDEKSETFSENDFNLLDDENIIKKENCVWYLSSKTGKLESSCDIVPAAIRLLIISASIIY